jgi:diguanylate cyclase (GGDEF)-like protein
MARISVLRLAAAVSLASALALPGALAALDPARRLTQYAHDAWTTDDGLPQGSVLALAEGGKGELWVGTQEGLVRFDGYRFESFEEIAGAALPGPHVLALAAARGALWIGTDAGVVRWRAGRPLERWTTADGLPANAVYALAEGSAGEIWIGTQAGLALWSAGKVEPVRPAGESLETIYALLADSAGRLWIGTAARGLLLLEGAPGAFRARPVGPRVAAVYSLREAPTGTIVAALSDAGILELAPGADLGSAAPRRFGSAVSALLPGSAGSLWIGTGLGALARRRGDALEALDGDDRLAIDEIAVLLEDSEGSLWIGTDGAGLHRLRDGALVPWGAREGLADEIGLVVLGGADGTVWFGTENGGLSRLAGGAIENLAGRNGVPREAVLALAETGDGTLWFGTKGAGLCRFAGGRAACERFGSGLARGSVSALLEDRAGTLWAGTPEGLFRRSGDGFVLAAPGTPLERSFVLALFESRAGDLLAGTYGAGTFARAAGSAVWTALETPLPVHATAFLEDADGTLWIATAGQGLLRRRAGRFSRFTRRDGLADDTLYALLDDGAGHLWTSGNRGVARIARASLDGEPGEEPLRLRLFDRADGARSAECNGGTQPAAARDRAGRLWFPTLRGFVSYSPPAAERLALLPATRVARVAIDGRRAATGETVVVPAGADRVEIRLLLASLRARERLGFRYRLEGYDRDWNETGAAGDLLYRRLPAGRYRLDAVARDADGVESPAHATLALEVLPRLHETAGFRLLAAATVALAAFALYRLRLRGLEARERTLAALVAQRTRELAEANALLQSANAELQRLSATDPLTGLANRRRFDEQLEVEWRRALRTGQPLALVAADIDRFKAYNDALGHPAGDACLARVAGALAGGGQRAGDLAARVGGEEFALLLPSTDRGHAAEIAERVRAAVAALAIAHPASPDGGRVTVSVGAASARRGEESAARLLERADRALYRAKQAGRNRAVVDDE